MYKRTYKKSKFPTIQKIKNTTISTNEYFCLYSTSNAGLVATRLGLWQLEALCPVEINTMISWSNTADHDRSWSAVLMTVFDHEWFFISTPWSFDHGPITVKTEDLENFGKGNWPNENSWQAPQFNMIYHDRPWYHCRPW